MAHDATGSGHAHFGTSAYDLPQTADEITRRTFMAKATVAIGGLIGLGLAIPIVGSLIPDTSSGGAKPSPLDAAGWKELQAATDKAVQISFTLKNKDAYLPEESSPASVWGIKTSLERFKAARPDIFLADGKLNLPFPYSQANVMGFTVFSPICPHLGCRYNYDAANNKFACPCHGSQFDYEGKHIAGPAARGLDPLPLNIKDGDAEVTWIRYRSTIPDRLVVSYTS